MGFISYLEFANLQVFVRNLMQKSQKLKLVFICGHLFVCRSQPNEIINVQLYLKLLIALLIFEALGLNSPYIADVLPAECCHYFLIVCGYPYLAA